MRLRTHILQIYSMHESVLAIVKQAQVETQHKSNDGEIIGTQETLEIRFIIFPCREFVLTCIYSLICT